MRLRINHVRPKIDEATARIERLSNRWSALFNNRALSGCAEHETEKSQISNYRAELAAISAGISKAEQMVSRPIFADLERQIIEVDRLDRRADALAASMAINMHWQHTYTNHPNARRPEH